MTKSQENEIYIKSLSHFGVMRQWDKLSEEMSELNQAIMKYPSLFPYLGGEVDRDSKLFTAKDVAIGIYPNEDETIPMISPNQIQI